MQTKLYPPRKPADLVAQRALGPWNVLRIRNYALLFWGQLFSVMGTQIQVVALSWQMYLLTHSAVALGLIGLMQAIPRLCFSLIGGVLADMMDRRKLLLLINLAMLLCSTMLALCTSLQLINLVFLYVLILLGAVVSSFEFPTRIAILPNLVPRTRLADAISLDLMAYQLAAIIGPSAGGLAIAWLGLANTYWFTVISSLVVIGSLFALTVPAVSVEKRAQGGLRALYDGFRFLHAHPIILALLTLDFCATFFGSPRALLPVYAQDIMHIGPQGLGILLAAIPLGAVALTPLTGFVSRIRRQGLGVALAIILWGICIVAFGFFPTPLWLGVLLLAGAGAADMVSSILRGIMVQTTAPDEFRGRVNAVNAMFVMGGPLLGQFESGLVGGLLTPTISVVSGGAACIIATLLILALVPSLIKAQPGMGERERRQRHC